MPLETHVQLLEKIEQYTQKYPIENVETEKFTNFIHQNLDVSVYARTNFDGHFTASAFIVNEAKTHVLLLKHKKLNRWLQPGGHIDETDDSVFDAALREICEETGLQTIDLQLIGNSFPFDLDAHIIPENIIKNEPQHTHYDIRFLISVNKNAKLDVNAEEADGLKWLTFSELEKLDDFKKVAMKLIGNLS